jgi:hypothetical protein
MAVQAYPTRLRLFSLAQSRERLLAEIALDVHGPVREFTLVLDLERSCIRLWGHAKEGYFRLRMVALADQESVGLFWEKAPEAGIGLTLSGKLHWDRVGEAACTQLESRYCAKAKDFLLLYHSLTMPFPTAFEAGAATRLSLGSHRAQNWDSICQRLDLADVLPIWSNLSQQVKVPVLAEFNELALLQPLQQAVAEKEPVRVQERLQELFRFAFRGILCPRWQDVEFQGLKVGEGVAVPDLSPMHLLHASGQVLSKLFLSADETLLAPLPCLPPELHAGRYLAVRTPWGEVDMEWSKKTVRRLIVRAEKDAEISVNLGKGLRSYRLRRNSKDNGAVLDESKPLRIEAGQHYFLDRFER